MKFNLKSATVLMTMMVFGTVNANQPLCDICTSYVAQTRDALLSDYVTNLAQDYIISPTCSVYSLFIYTGVDTAHGYDYCVQVETEYLYKVAKQFI